MSRLLIAVEVVGGTCAAGPVTAGAVFYPSELEEPVFNYRNEKGAIVPGRFITKGGMPEHLRPAVMKALRDQAVGWAVLSRSAAQVRERGAHTACLDVLGMCAARLLERLKMTTPDALSGATAQDITILVSHDFRPPPELVPLHVTVQKSTDWRLKAAALFAQQRRVEEMLELSLKYPQYGFEINQGLMTKQHREAIRRFGLTPEHRR